MYTNEQILSAVNKALAEKGSRKFVQSIELAVNFKGLDMSKAENKLNLEVALPKGRGKKMDVVVFAEGNLANDAKAAGADRVISGAEIPALKLEIKKAAKHSEFFAQPQLMMVVGKNLGQILGGRGKLPKPIVGNVGMMIKGVRNTVKVRTRGKNLPVVHCPIGVESMPAEEILENANAVFTAIRSKIGEQSLKSAYVKLSMGKPIRIE
ncbi:50S ribosomal protein L1 [uncultured archaeon]|nr:50S ribosomal protein L1 [uncultured archaeon]